MQVNISFVIKAGTSLNTLKTIHSGEVELEHMPCVGDTFKFPALFNEFASRFSGIAEPEGVVFDSGVELSDIEIGSPYLVVYVPTSDIHAGHRRIVVARGQVLKHNGWL